MLLNLFSNMILSIIGWMCLFTLCQSKVIEVNSKGKDSNVCCKEGKCLCGSLFEALFHVENNTVINITSSVPLHNSTHVETLNNITVIGNNITVRCNNNGIVTCVNCSNVLIQGITWDQCGNPNSHNVTYAIGFKSASDVSIRACTFQYSKVCTVIFLQLLSGYVEVHNSKFLFNHVTNLSQCKDMHASLAIVDNLFEKTKRLYFTDRFLPERFRNHNYYGAPFVSVSIIGTSFDHNGASDYPKQYGNVPSSATLLCFLTGQEVENFLIQNVNISDSSGLGASLFFLDMENNTNIEFTNVTFYNNSNGGSIVRFSTFSDVVLSINFCSYEYNVNGSLKLVVDAWKSNVMFYRLTVTGNEGTLVGKDRLFGKNSIGHGVGILLWTNSGSSDSDISMLLCNIQNNSGNKSIAFIESNNHNTRSRVSIKSSNFINNSGSALHVSNNLVELEGDILFINNSAVRGAAIYLEQNSQIAIGENSVIKFTGNKASQQGGAIYVTFCYTCDFLITDPSNVSFTDNSAVFAGNSIYFSNPDNANNSTIYKFDFPQPPGLSTSPYKINLCSTTCIETKSSCDITSRIMLGQLVGINATVCDYYGNVSESSQFYVECINCNNKYKLSNNRIIVHNELLNVVFLAVGHNGDDVVNKENVMLNLSLINPNKDYSLTATLSLELSSCQSGYEFDAHLQHCKCYQNKNKDIIHCQRDFVEIKHGHWFGLPPPFSRISSNRTVSVCPIHYCNYIEDTGNDYYKLPEELDGQCSSHRTGVACGKCIEGYTLAYNSPVCINENECHPGITVLVITLTILYYIIVVALVFSIMQVKVSLGYAYGLIYYYSIVDTLLENNLFISEVVFQLVTIISSFVKLTPKFLGKLCFVKCLSGIDQLFIHYFHAISIFCLIIVTVKVAKYSRKIASIVSHCIIRVICLLSTLR